MENNGLFYHKTLFSIEPQDQQSGMEEVFRTVLQVLRKSLNLYHSIQVSEQELLPKSLHHIHDRAGHKLAVAVWQHKDGSVAEWALSVSWDEPIMQRRRWSFDIGVMVKASVHIEFSFLARYHDRLGGCLKLLRPPKHEIPQVLQSIMKHVELVCTSGGSSIPLESIELTMDHLQIFVDALENSQRRLPMILITCPEIIIPAGVMHRMRGNAIIYHTDNRPMVQELNKLLSPDAHVQYGGIQIFLPPSHPGNKYPRITHEEIGKLGGKAVVDILSQAYAENPTKRELGQCVTYDTIAAKHQEAATQRASVELKALKEKLLAYERKT